MFDRADRACVLLITSNCDMVVGGRCLVGGVLQCWTARARALHRKVAANTLTVHTDLCHQAVAALSIIISIQRAVELEQCDGLTISSYNQIMPTQVLTNKNTWPRSKPVSIIVSMPQIRFHVDNDLNVIK